MTNVPVKRVRRQRRRSRRAGRAEGFAEGFAVGMAKARAVSRYRMRRQVLCKFGADTAANLATLMAGTDDFARLAEVGEWIIDRRTGDDLIARCRAG